MLQLIFNIPLISVNKLYVNIKGQGRRFVSSEGKKFKTSIETTVKQAITKSALNYLSSLEGKRLELNIKIISPSWVLKDGITIRKKDVENNLKALNDSVFNAIKELNISLDDSQIWSLTLIKEVGNIEQTTYTILEYM